VAAPSTILDGEELVVPARGSAVPTRGHGEQIGGARVLLKRKSPSEGGTPCG
jgi:hypothetical protein